MQPSHPARSSLWSARQIRSSPSSVGLHRPDISSIIMIIRCKC